jgi:hypothetical protein
MVKLFRAALVAGVLLGACGGNIDKGAPGGSPSTGGDGGDGSQGGASAGGSGGKSPSGLGGGGGGLGSVDAAATGGTSGSSGAAGGEVDASAGGGEGGEGGASGASLSWYEGEAGVISGRAVRAMCTACPSSAGMKPGDACCSGGGEVKWLVAHGNGELQFKGVSVPADGMYDVTWWYFCGKNDHFGDRNCGGQTDPPTTASGCRPHQFFVNGTLMPGAYHFPCFSGMWNLVRAATVTMPLKAGANNTIKLHAPPPRDSVNVDAIAIFPPGKGLPPLITSTKDLTGH